MKACQTCLQVLVDGTPAFRISDAHSDGGSGSFTTDAITIKDKLADCIPELLLDTIDDAVLCQSCVNSLMAAYNFKQTCLDSQNKIHGYLQQIPINSEVDVGKIALYYKRLEVVADGGDPMKIDIAGRASKEANVSASSTAAKKTTILPGFVRPKSPPSPTSEANHEGLPMWLTSNFPNRQKYMCTVCGEAYKGFSVFSFHMIAHDNKKNPKKCNQCEFVSGDPKTLKVHMKGHMRGVKIYRCSVCKFETNGRKVMLKHSLNHKHAFSCHVCKWNFPNKIELAMHIRDHSRDPMMYCELCNFQCSKPNKMNKHRKLHDTDTYLQCKECIFKTQNEDLLKLHVEKQHKSNNTSLEFQYRAWSRNCQQLANQNIQQPGSSTW